MKDVPGRVRTLILFGILQGPEDLTISLGDPQKRPVANSGVPRVVRNLGTRRVVIDDIGVTSGVSTTTPRQSDMVKSGLFRVKDEGRVTGTGTNLRPARVETQEGPLWVYRLRWVGVTRIGPF